MSTVTCSGCRIFGLCLGEYGASFHRQPLVSCYICGRIFHKESQKRIATWTEVCKDVAHNARLKGLQLRADHNQPETGNYWGTMESLCKSLACRQRFSEMTMQTFEEHIVERQEYKQAAEKNATERLRRAYHASKKMR